MLDPKKLSKLTVGDLSNFDRWRRDNQRKELVKIAKELYGDNIPENAYLSIRKELDSIKPLVGDEGEVDESLLTLDTAQFLLWRALLHKDPQITFEEAGNQLVIDEDNLEECFDLLFPATMPAQKKTKKRSKRKKVKRKKRNKSANR